MRDNARTRNSIRILVGRISFAFSVLLLGACGGGTTGTGGTGGSVIEGRLLDTDGAPVNAALLTIIETGDSSTTDPAGEFSIETELLAPSVTLLVESGATKAEAVVDDIPTGEQSVDLDLELNPAQKTVKVKAKRVKPRPTRTPLAPTPTISVPTPSPAEPTEVPVPIPTVPPAETATPEATPTSVPTVTAETPVPTATVTIAPTATPQLPVKTKFTGTIHADDPSILIGAEVNIPGRGRKTVESDGTFKFFVSPSNLNGIIAIHAGGKTDRLLIAGVSERSAEVNLDLNLAVRPNGGIKLTLISVEIIERSSGETAPATEEEAGDSIETEY